MGGAVLGGLAGAAGLGLLERQGAFRTPAEEASLRREQALAGAFEALGPTITETLQRGVPAGVEQRVIGRGEEIARRQAEAFGGRFQQAGQAFTPLHARGEIQLRGDIARQTQEALADLEFRLQQGTVGALLGTPTQAGPSGLSEFLQSGALLGSLFG
jgi:hypothetical protein